MDKGNPMGAADVYGDENSRGIYQRFSMRGFCISGAVLMQEIFVIGKLPSTLG
jgi:hypothetical protein